VDPVWSIIAKPKNREILSWIGGAVVVVAAGAFAVVTYLWLVHDGKGRINCTENASIATQGDVSHVTITVHDAPACKMTSGADGIAAGNDVSGNTINQSGSENTAQIGTSLVRPGAPLVQAPPPAPSAPSAFRSLSTVDEALENLRAAKVAFNTPDKARVGKQFIVEAKLATHLRSEELEVLLEEPGRHEVATLKVSDRMAATLSGGSAFDVSPTGSMEQWISDNEPTEWSWQVTPKSVGEQALILSFDALISLNGKDDRRTINTFKRRISVDVGWPETVGEWLELIKKTGENVSWIWATLLIPIGGGAWAWIKRRARPPEPSKTDLS
jgi:hypothetical protein